jgi:predicted RNase H-like nuclease
VTFVACASGSERSATHIDDRDASSLDRLAASIDALALSYGEPNAKEAGKGDGNGEAPVGEVVAMPIRSARNAGVFFEPEEIAVMSDALEDACKALRDAGEPKVVREVIAGRIIAAACIGERDPARLRAAALAGRQAARR